MSNQSAVAVPAGLSANKKRAIRFLAQGLSTVQVASIVGCTPAMLLALQKDDPEFQAALAEALSTLDSKEVTEETEEEMINGRYLALEHGILRQIGEQIVHADLKDAVRALEVVASRQERRADRAAKAKIPAAQPGFQQNVAVLVMPAQSAQQYKVPEVQYNAQNEIIAVGNESLAPMGSSVVRELFQSMKPLPVQYETLGATVPADF